MTAIPVLGPIEQRVLLSLVEKQLTTPDHYPLTLNALATACNQSSNREPVMSLSEETVMETVTALRRAGLVRSFQGIGSRVSRYEQLLADVADLSRSELAVLCVLALRGPQTTAEVRTRIGRMVPEPEVERVGEVRSRRWTG